MQVKFYFTLNAHTKSRYQECAWYLSEIETSSVSELKLVLMKIDLRQADNSGFLGVNYPCHYSSLMITKQTKTLDR